MSGSDKERWITLANGNRCRLDENGVVTAGPKIFQGKHISECGGQLTDTTPDTEGYARAVAANGGDHYAGARQFFQEKLQGHSVKCRTADGEREAQFTGGTWQEIKRDMKGDPVKAELVPHMPDIIATGAYKKNDVHKERNDGASAFHEYRKTVQTSQGPREVVVDVVQRSNQTPEYSVYNLTREGSRGYETRKKAEDSKTGLSPLSLGPSLIMRGKPGCYDSSISPQFEVVNLRIEEAKPMNDTLTLDAAPSRRHRDENGFLHVDGCHITREQVAPYYGREIPGWEELGLAPERLYHAYRPAEELEKAAPTINGLPILWGHSPESADAPQLDRRIGSMGTDAAFHAPYLDNSLIFTVAEAIDAIEDGRERELSLSYRYEPDFTPGTFEGQPYDFVMRNLRGNHLALVPEGRAGASCCVADAAPDAKGGEGWITTENGKHIHFKDGEIDKGNIGQKDWDSPSAQGARRDKVENAMREIANGKAEATVPGLRNDLEQYGGTNDVTIIKGDAKKGLVHIEQRHGAACVAPVLEAVANGKITRFVEGNKTVHIDKDGYRAVLSLEEHGKKKTWLLTGYDIWEDTKKEPTGDSGKVSARHAATHDGPILSRPDMGAMDSFRQRIEQLLKKSNHQTRKGGLMSKFKNLFRGASDADPENAENRAPEGQGAPEAPQAEPAPEGKPEGKGGMDEGLKAAMDKCGLDAEDPAAQAAFAEGVKYGEALMREKGEREKLDSEHEAEGMKKAEDGEASAAPAGPAVDEEKVAQTASDAALRKFQSILDAQAEVRPHVGEMRVNLAKDSAATIYGAALDALGIDRKDTPAAAWRGMFRTAVNLQRRDNSRAMAQDAARAKGPLAGLNNISSL